MYNRQQSFEILARGRFKKNDLIIVKTANRMKNAIRTDTLTSDGQIEGQTNKSFSLCRLHRWKIFEGNKLILTLGETSYKEYVRTRNLNFLQTHGWDYVSNPLAVCGAIITSDMKLLIGKRNNRVDAYKNFFHVPGSGFVKLPRDADSKGIPSPFKAILSEIYEELNVTKIDEITCSGLAYDLLKPHPELTFIVKLGVSFAELVSTFLEGVLEKEFDQITALDVTKPDELKNFLSNNNELIVPTCKACLELFRVTYSDLARE